MMKRNERSALRYGCCGTRTGDAVEGVGRRNRRLGTRRSRLGQNGSRAVKRKFDVTIVRSAFQPGDDVFLRDPGRLKLQLLDDRSDKVIRSPRPGIEELPECGSLQGTL